MSNNIRDIEEDIKGGRKTLVILRERESSGNTCYSLFIAYLWIAVIVLMGYISPWALVMFLGLRKPISAIRSFQKEQKIGYMRIAMKSTAMTNTIFGFLLSAGLLISYLF